MKVTTMSELLIITFTKYKKLKILSDTMKLRIKKNPKHCLIIEMKDEQEVLIHNLPDNCTVITDKLYGGNKKIVSMEVVSPHVKQIHINAFEGCTELTEVILSPSVKYIEANAFAGCNKLKEIIVDESIDRVDYRFSAAVKVTEHRPFKSLIENLKNGIPVELHEKDEMSWSDWN